MKFPPRSGKLRCWCVPFSVIALWQFLSLASVATETQPGELDLTFDAGPGPDAVVRVVLVESHGGILLAGAFGSVDTRERTTVARLMADGRVDEQFVPPTLDGEVLALAEQADGKIILAGRITSGDGRHSVARLNADGSPDSDFKLLSGGDGSVWAIALQPDGKIVIGGDFTVFGGQPRSRLARLNSDGTLDAEFRANSVIDASLRAVKLLPDGRFLIAGNFTSVDGAPRQRIARLNTDGTLDATFDPGGADSWISVLAVQPDGAVLIGGSFRSVAGTPRRGIARLDPDGELDRTFNPGLGANESTSAIVLQSDGKILVGGGFKKMDGLGRKRIARLYPDGAVDPFFEPAPGANDWVETIAIQSDGRILIGGNFSEVDHTRRSRIARLQGGNPPPHAPHGESRTAIVTTRSGADVTLRADLPAVPQPSYRWFLNGVEIAGANRDTLRLRNVRGDQAGDYKVVAANRFGFAERLVAVVNVAAAGSEPGDVDTSFHPGSGPDSTVYALAVQLDDKVLIGGAFRFVNDVLFNGVARLHPDGSIDQTFHPNTPGVIRSLAAESDGKTLVGGAFRRGDSAASLIAAQLNSDGGFDATFQPVNGSGYVSKILRLPNQKILIGGTFDLVNQTPRNAATFLNANGSSDNSVDLGFGAGAAVYAMNLEPDNQILLGGFFTTVKGVPRINIVRINLDGTVDPNFDPGIGPNGSVRAMALQSDGKIIIAGRFTKVGLVPRLRIARLNSDGTLDPSFDAGPLTAIDNITSVTAQPDGKVLIGTTFADGTFAVARLESDGTIDGSFATIPVPDRPFAGPSASVQCIEILRNGMVLIGGDFKKVSGVTRPRVARLFGGEKPAAPPLVLSSPADRTVFAGADLILQVIASSVPPATYQWQFNGVDLPGETRAYLSLHNLRGTNSGAYTAVVRNTLGAATSAPAILNVLPPAYHAGAPDINFYTGLGPNDQVNDVAAQPDGKIVIAGVFTEVNGTVRGRVARLNNDGSLDLSFNPAAGANGAILALALQSDGGVVIGGTFSSVNGAPRSNLARLNANGTLDLTFNNGVGPNGGVNEIAIQMDGAVLVGGAFTQVNGVDRASLARLLSNGTVDPTFTPDLSTNALVQALAVQNDNAIVVGGFFSSADGLLHSNLVRLNPNGRVDPSFNPGVRNGVNTIAIEPDSQLLIGGNFDRVNGVRRDHLVRLNADGTLDASFAPLTDDAVFAITLQPDGKILVGGSFEIVNLVSRPGLARLNANGTLDPAFETGSGIAGGTLELNEYGELGEFRQRPVVSAIALQTADAAVIGGNFSTVSEAARPYVARVFLRDVAAIDGDNDGLPDLWEQEYGLDPQDPGGVNGGNGDFDGDGRSNRIEYIAGSNPRRADSFEPKLIVTRAAAGVWTLRFFSLRGRTYRIYFTSDLTQPFVPVGPAIAGTGSEVTWTDDGTQTGGNPAQRFYKLEVQLAPP